MSVVKEAAKFNFLPACKICENYWPQLLAIKNSAGEKNYHSYWHSLFCSTKYEANEMSFDFSMSMSQQGGISLSLSSANIADDELAFFFFRFVSL
jgi:hypothetical protein